MTKNIKLTVVKNIVFVKLQEWLNTVRNDQTN